MSEVKKKRFKVFVVDAAGKPLLPTTPARARILMKKGRAKPYRMVPFTIQLNYVVENPVGEFTAAVDDGAKFIGVAVKGKDEIVFVGNVRLRQDVKRRVHERAMYRRSRRSRNKRHRKCRRHRKRGEGWLPPSIRYRKEVVLRILRDLRKLLNITKVVIEFTAFDTYSLVVGHKLKKWEYWVKRYEGCSPREKALIRDNYQCRLCGKRVDLEVHHILPRSRGGTNVVENLITLCRSCHRAVHEGKVVIPKSLRKENSQVRYATLVQTGKWWLFGKLKEIFGVVEVVYGYQTKQRREALYLPKDHWADACALLGCGKLATLVWKIIPKRHREYLNHPTKKCNERYGFRHWDLVRVEHKTKGVFIGAVRALKEKQMTVRTKFADNFAVSYKRCKLLWRFGGLIYLC